MRIMGAQIVQDEKPVRIPFCFSIFFYYLTAPSNDRVRLATNYFFTRICHIYCIKDI